MKKLIFSFLLIISFLMIQDLFSTKCNAIVSETAGIDSTIDNENTLKKIYQKSKELMNLLQENINLKNLNSSHYASTAIDASSVILHKFAEIFSFIVDKADKLTSKKFVLATLIAIGPLVAIYCKYFDPEPLRILISSFWGTATEGAVDVTVTTGEAVADKILEYASNNPTKIIWTGTKIGIISSVPVLTYQLITMGIPWILGAVIKKGLKDYI